MVQRFPEATFLGYYYIINYATIISSFVRHRVEHWNVQPLRSRPEQECGGRGCRPRQPGLHQTVPDPRESQSSCENHQQRSGVRSNIFIFL